MVVIGLVAVDVDAQTVLLGQREGEQDRLDAVLARQPVVRDPADDVRAECDRLRISAAPSSYAKMPCCGNATICRSTRPARLLPQLDQRSQCAQVGITDIDMRTHVLHSAGELQRNTSRARVSTSSA